MTDLVERRSPLVEMSKRLSMEANILNDVLKKTAFRNCKSKEEFIAAVVVANMYKLNPLRNEIYAFPNKGGVQPIVSVDGWAKVITCHPNFDGMEFTEIDDLDGSIKACKCTIWIKGKSHPVSVTEYTDELKMNSEPWKKMPRRMTRHGAMKQCGRVSLGITGIYDEDDAVRMGGSAGDLTPPPLVSLGVKSAETIPENSDEEQNSSENIGKAEASQIYKQASKQGLKEKDIKALIKHNYGIDSLGDLPVGELAEFLNKLSDMSMLKEESEKEN